MNYSPYPGVILVEIGCHSHLRVGRNSFGGLGITILDSLSTLWLMGLDEEFNKAPKKTKSSLRILVAFRGGTVAVAWCWCGSFRKPHFQLSITLMMLAPLRHLLEGLSHRSLREGHEKIP